MGKYDRRELWERATLSLLRLAKQARFRFRPALEKEVVFVSGMQRSGTNLVMELLDRSFFTDVYHETDPRAFDAYHLRSLDIIRGLVESSRAPRVIFKALLEADRVSELLEEFAPARAVWVIRDYRSVVRSAVASFRRFAFRMARLAEDPTSVGWYGAGMSPETLAHLRRAYEPDISEESAAAMMWYFRNVLYFEQGLDKRSDVLLLRYEDLLSTPESQVRALYQFVGIPVRARVAGWVKAGSKRPVTDEKISPYVRHLCEHLQLRFEAVLKHVPAPENLRSPNALKPHG